MPPAETNHLDNNESGMCIDNFDYTMNPPPFTQQPPPPLSSEPQFSWEMVGLGLEEPLPTQDVIDEL